MPRVSGLVLALLVLAACDAASPDPDPPPVTPPGTPHALVGTLTTRDYLIEHYATSSISQDWIAYDEPPSGSIALSGAETGRLRFGVVDYNTADESATFASDPVGFAPRSYPHFFLRARRSYGYPRTRFELQVRRSASQVEVYEAETSSPPFTLNGASLTLPAATLTRAFGEPQVVLEGGTLVFPIIALQADTRTRVRRHEQPPSAGYSVQYTIKPDNSLIVTETVPPQAPVTVAGTWTATSDSLRLSYGPYVTRPLRYRYAISGTEVVLWSRDVDGSCSSVATCDPRGERYGLAPRTLRRLDIEFGGRFHLGGGS